MEQTALAKQNKLVNHQVGIMDTLIRHDAEAAKKVQKSVERRNTELKQERTTQEQVGVVNKAAKIGRFTYKMRKTDFQMEDELAPSLRQIRH